MKPGGKEHEELIKQFERDMGYRNLEREKSEVYIKLGYVFENGEINKEFKAYRIGYSFGKFVAGTMDTQPAGERIE